MTRQKNTARRSPYRQPQQHYRTIPVTAPRPANLSVTTLTAKPHRTRHFLVVLALALSVFFGARTLLARHAHAAMVRQTVQQQQAQTARVNALAPQINALIAANPQVTFSVSLVNTRTGALQHFGDSDPYVAASTAKLLTAAAYLHGVERGTYGLHDSLDGDDAQDLLEQMIVNSDDPSWQTLNDAMTHDSLVAYAQSIGLGDYDADNNMLTSDDIAQLLQKLYTGKLLNGTHTRLLLSYLKQANYRDFMVPAVPVGDTIYHKAGLTDDEVHDAAIISKGNESFVAVIFTDGHGTYNWDARSQVMHAITKAAIAAYLP